MLEPKAIFNKFQFVQEIAFKNKDIHRHDLGIERFGYILSSHVVARTHCEYVIQYAKENDQNLSFEYSLRPLTDVEIQERLSYIALHQQEFMPFIVALNNCDALKPYHIEEANCVKEYRSQDTRQTA